MQVMQVIKCLQVMQLMQIMYVIQNMNVSFRALKRDKPDHAAAIYHNFVYYMLMNFSMLKKSGNISKRSLKCFWSWTSKSCKYLISYKVPHLWNICILVFIANCQGGQWPSYIQILLHFSYSAEVVQSHIPRFWRHIC